MPLYGGLTNGPEALPEAKYNKVHVTTVPIGRLDDELRRRNLTLDNLRLRGWILASTVSHRSNDGTVTLIDSLVRTSDDIPKPEDP